MFKLTVWGLCFSVFCSGEKSFFGGRANRPKKDYHHPDLSKKSVKNKKAPNLELYGRRLQVKKYYFEPIITFLNLYIRNYLHDSIQKRLCQSG
jgi:hypothetical protein